MAKCKYCNQKKGKRDCPSLNDKICNLCCGQHRDKEIRCTVDCSFSSNTKTYTVEKNEKNFHDHTVNFFHSIFKKYKELGKHFIVFIDTKLYELLYEKKNFKDSDAISLLNALRGHLSPVEFLQLSKSEFIAIVFEDADKFLKRINLSRDKALDITDCYIKQINDYTDGVTNTDKWAQQFLNIMKKENVAMCEQYEKNRSLVDKKIITPGTSLESIQAVHGKDVNSAVTGGKIIIPG